MLLLPACKRETQGNWVSGFQEKKRARAGALAERERSFERKMKGKGAKKKFLQASSQDYPAVRIYVSREDGGNNLDGSDEVDILLNLPLLLIQT